MPLCASNRWFIVWQQSLLVLTPWFLSCRLRSTSHCCIGNSVRFEDSRDIEALRSEVNMGIAISCPGAAYDSINDSLEAVLNRSIGLGDNVRSTLQSIGFNGRDYCLPAILEAFGLAKSLIKGSFHLEPKISTKSPALEPDNSTKSDDLEGLKFTSLVKRSRESTSIRPDNPKHEAAVKLQKVYKSFRTRRQLADCAVLVEQHWYTLHWFVCPSRIALTFDYIVDD